MSNSSPFPGLSFTVGGELGGGVANGQALPLKAASLHRTLHHNACIVPISHCNLPAYCQLQRIILLLSRTVAVLAYHERACLSKSLMLPWCVKQDESSGVALALARVQAGSVGLVPIGK